MHTFFITGIKGFIGTNLANFLIKRGFNVKGIDNLSSPSHQILDEKVNFQEADILKPEEYLSFMKDSDYVIHLAAMSRSGPSIGKDLFCISQNLYGTQKILEASIETNIKRIIYAGSSTYYGSSKVPHKVGAPPDFLNSYGFSKYLGEEAIKHLSKGKIEFNILRLFNVFGPGQPFSGPYALVLGIFLKQHSLGKPLTIHGDGSQTRDFIHVEDVSNAFLKASISDSHSKVFNVGSGKRISILEIANMVSEKYIFEARREGDAKDTQADIKETVLKLNWEIKVDPIIEIKNIINQNKI